MEKMDIRGALEQGRVTPLLLRLSFPIILAQLVHVLYNIVDRMFIGRMPGVGTAALAGLGFTMPIIMTMSAFSMLIGMGGAPLVSIRLGEGDREAAARIQGCSMALILAVGAVLTVGVLLFRDPLLLLFGISRETMGMASQYIGIYALGTVFLMIGLGMTSFLNAQGCTGEGMLTVIAGAVINIVLDPLMIYTFGLGVAGAAWATVIAQGVSAVLTLYFLTHSKQMAVRLRRSDIRVHPGDTLEICKLGLSSFIFDINESVVQILVNLMLRRYGGSVAMGDLYIGVMTLLNTLLQVFFMPLKGIVRGAQPIIGHCFGARDYGRLMQTVKSARVCSITCAVAVWAAVMLFPHTLAHVFTDDPAMLEMTARFARLFFCTIFVLGLQMVNQHSFIAMGNARLSFFFGILRKILILVPLMFLLPPIFGVEGVFLAEPLSNVVTVIITQIVFTRYMGQVRLRFQGEAA